MSRRRRGAGAREAAEEQRLTGVGTADGRAASMSELRSGWRWGRRGGRDAGGAGEATVGATVACGRRSGRGGVGEVTAAARSAGRLSGGRGAVEAAVRTRGALS
jgi:hypothetical protein